ncbi:MAG: hypothetical protein J7J94_04595 [Thaumarchaeota archaeon]|nr:hypothetical protein [Nitrososphaerota archaeon]
MSEVALIMRTPPSVLLGFTGPASWIFDLALLGGVGGRVSVAEAVRRGRDLRLPPEQRRRLYAR